MTAVDFASVQMHAEDLARRCRRDVLLMTHRARAAHVGSALSVLDILSAIYAFKAALPNDNNEVILSKGHSGAALYAILAETGAFPIEELDTYCLNGSRLWGHATVGVPGIRLSTGSLGHGLPFGVGRALADQRMGQNERVIVVMSDGEMQEGTTWESALIAAQYRLENLTVVIDRNGLQSLASTEATIALDPLDAKWRAFGWNVLTVDGHEHGEILAVLTTPQEGPTCVIATTTKGKGVSFMEREVSWHYTPPSTEQVDAALRELG